MKSVASKAVAKIKIAWSTQGQSLVEMAIVTPLLIFMLIGLFEVGWALRGYLTLVNANREITRFAVRPNYLNYSAPDPTLPDYGVGYEKVQNYLFTTLSDQLELNLDQNGTLIISHMVIDTGWPCDPDDISNPKKCDCEKFDVDSSDYDPTYGYNYDDLIQYPGQPGFDLSYSYIYTYPVSTTYRSRIDFAAEAEKLATENNKFNCELLQKTKGTAPVSANNLVTTELFFGQRMLFGFPLISNPFTDPVPMYTHTTMRVPGCPRSSNNCSTSAPLCLVSPMTVWENDWQTWNEGDIVDILGGPNSSDYGWLSWDPQDTSDDYLRGALQFSRASINIYTNVADPDDHRLNVGDWVRSLQGVNATADAINNYIVGRELIIPVYDDIQKLPNPDAPPAQVDAYKIKRFIRVRPTGVFDLGSPDKYIEGVYLGEAGNMCQ